MMESCDNCGVGLKANTWKDSPVKYRVTGPWAPLYELWIGTCPNCRTALRSLVTDFDPTPVNWNRVKENMTIGADYKVINRRRGSSDIGVKPFNVFWLWNPIVDTTVITTQIAAALQKAAASSIGTGRPLLIVGTMIPAVVNSVMSDQVWQVTHDMMQGQVGPHPSLRAELTLIRTLSLMYCQQFFHCWPSASLPPADYLPLATDDQLPVLWAQSARQNIRVKINP